MSNNLEKTNKNASYVVYIVIGVLYLLVKIIFVLAGYLHVGAIFHGLVPCALTVTGGILAYREIKNSKKAIWHKVMIILPILSFVLTPIYMYIREKEMWLTNGRLEVLVIYEILAIIQVFLALKCNKSSD